MAIDVQAITDGLATNLRTVTGDILVVPYYDDLLPTDANWTVAEIGLKSGENEVNIEEADTSDDWLLHFEVTLYLAHMEAETAQKQMLGWLGIAHGDTTIGEIDGQSVWNALQSNRSLGGVARKTLVRRSHSYAVIQRGGQRLIMNSWDVDVIASA